MSQLAVGSVVIVRTNYDNVRKGQIGRIRVNDRGGLYGVQFGPRFSGTDLNGAIKGSNGAWLYRSDFRKPRNAEQAIAKVRKAR